VIDQAAYRRRWRPTRFGLAAIIGAAVLLDVVVSSAASFAFGPVPLRATLFGLPAIALAAASTFFLVRAVHEQDPASRTRDGTRAAVLLVAALFLWLVVLDVYTFTQEAGPGVAAICALACVPTTAAGLWIVRRLDRNEKEPWRLVLVATLWGAIVSTSLVLWGEALWDAVFTANLVPGPAADTSSAYSAGIFEELSKGTAVLLLYLLMRDEFDDVVDGIVYGAAVGLGFNFMESVGYMTHLYATLAPEGAGGLAAAGQWYFRQVLGLFFGHATYTALIGAGVGIARQLPRLSQRIIVIACGFIAAIAAHFAWDAYQAFVLIGGTSTLMQFVLVHARYLIVVGPFDAVLLALLVMGLRLEGRALNRQLQAEVASGTGAVLPAEVATLMRPGRRFGARLAALGRGGAAAYMREARLQTAQLSLAMERWHRERDEIDEPMAAEDALRRRVLELRGTG
jgi:RsiW-degrading membrane proteinase PrsW (M82 family)